MGAMGFGRSDTNPRNLVPNPPANIIAVVIRRPLSLAYLYLAAYSFRFQNPHLNTWLALIQIIYSNSIVSHSYNLAFEIYMSQTTGCVMRKMSLLIRNLTRS